MGRLRIRAGDHRLRDEPGRSLEDEAGGVPRFLRQVVYGRLERAARWFRRTRRAVLKSGGCRETSIGGPSRELRRDAARRDGPGAPEQHRARRGDAGDRPTCPPSRCGCARRAAVSRIVHRPRPSGAASRLPGSGDPHRSPRLLIPRLSGREAVHHSESFQISGCDAPSTPISANMATAFLRRSMDSSSRPAACRRSARLLRSVASRCRSPTDAHRANASPVS